MVVHSIQWGAGCRHPSAALPARQAAPQGVAPCAFSCEAARCGEMGDGVEGYLRGYGAGLLRLATYNGPEMPRHG